MALKNWLRDHLLHRPGGSSVSIEPAARSSTGEPAPSLGPSEYDEFAEFYDLDYGHRSEDLDFYRSLALEQGGPVLEAACGTGRVMLPLLRDGREVWGLDSCRAMLDGLEAKLAREDRAVRARARVHLGDMCDFDLGRTFPLVIVPFRSFQHLLRREDQHAALACLRRHLAGGGRFVLSAYKPRVGQLLISPDLEVPNLQRRNPSTGNPVTRKHRIRQDLDNQISEVTFVYEETCPDGRVERTERVVNMRYMWPIEGELLLERAGFEVLEVFGDYQRTPHTYSSTDMIFFCAPV